MIKWIPMDEPSGVKEFTQHGYQGGTMTLSITALSITTISISIKM
jgi:hypothetical protein